MPSAIVEIRCLYPPEQETYLLQGVHDAIVHAFRVDPMHRNVTLIVHPAHRFLGRPDSPSPERLTNVSVYLRPGRSVQAKRSFYRRVTESFAAIGIPPGCVLIRLVELPAENFGVRGGQALCDIDLDYPVDV